MSTAKTAQNVAPQPHPTQAPGQPDAALLALFVATRDATERLCAPLSPEDQQLQSMPLCSPTKWHRAHTTWFLEKAILEPAGIDAVDARFGYLFNSYYESFGSRHPRDQRGLLSRPSAGEIGDYRRTVDGRVRELLESLDPASFARLRPLLELAIAHEEQHQELILTDILHAFSHNALLPAYLPPEPVSVAKAAAASSGNGAPRFLEFAGGVHEIGAGPGAGFCFDNELRRHKVWLEPFALAECLVTVDALWAFIRDGGYRTPSLWLAEGYDFVRAHDLRAPLYMREQDGVLAAFGLRGLRIPRADEPVAHVSYYEADALARYLGARLPTEAEWEVAAAAQEVAGNFVDARVLHALPAGEDATEPLQLYGDLWEWTASSYEAYPGYAPPPGAIGEYNGKFMVNQRVLRGGSCATPARHMRASYRNFWHPDTRFQLTGVRLARDVHPAGL